MRSFYWASLLLVTLTAVPANAVPPEDVIFYDADVNYDALPRILRSFNEHLSQKLPGYKVRAVDDVAALLEAVERSHAAYAIVSSESLDKLRKFGAAPLLVPESGGSVFYHKVLVDAGAGPPNIVRKRLAVATGDLGQSSKVLAMLEGAGLDVKGTSIVATTKDFDALLGLSFGQADAALVTSDSIDLLRNVNPGAVSALRTLWTSGDIMRPALTKFKTYEDRKDRQAVLSAFTEIMKSASGKSAMESLGFERWVPYNSELASKGRP